VSARLRYVALTAARTRAPLVPAAVTLFAVIGVFAQTRNPPGATWGLTSVLTCALAAWLTGAVLAGEPAPQAEMAGAALGGRRGRAALERRLVGAAALAVGLTFVAYPLLLVALRVEAFAPHATVADLPPALFAQLCGGVLGASVGVLFAPPRVTRRATAAAATGAALLALAALGHVLGPVAMARALTDDPAGGGRLVVTGASCLALSWLALLAADRWARRC
jgi:hypothetical protein